MFAVCSAIETVIFPLKTRPALDCYSQFSKGYEDYLQCPLQVIMQADGRNFFGH